MFTKVFCQQLPILFISIQLSLPQFPLVVTKFINAHNLAQEYHRIFCSECFNDSVLLSYPVTYSLFVPASFT